MNEEIKAVQLLYENAEKEMKAIKERLDLYKALINTFNNEKINTITTANAHPAKNTKKDLILNICKEINGDFCSGDVRRLLGNSTNEDLRNMKIAHISIILVKLAKEQKLLITKQSMKKGDSYYYRVNKEAL